MMNHPNMPPETPDANDLPPHTTLQG
ncbi:MAG: hypothetical protein RLZZ332_1222, partial [Actinomycetota bacterium]